MHSERIPTFGTSYKELPKDTEPPYHPCTLLPCPMLEVPEQESPEPWIQPCGSPLGPSALWESCRDSQWRRCAARVSKIMGTRVVVGMFCTRNMEVGLVNMKQHTGYS